MLDGRYFQLGLTAESSTGQIILAGWLLGFYIQVTYMVIPGQTFISDSVHSLRL